MSHSFEHVPIQHMREFLADLLRKLKPGGKMYVIQSDIRRCLELHHSGQLSFRALRTVIFPPADRLRTNRYNQHFNMWGAEDLAEDFCAAGFDRVAVFDAGEWRLDTVDELHPGAVERYHDVMIPNLGVLGSKNFAKVEPPRVEEMLLRSVRATGCRFGETGHSEGVNQRLSDDSSPSIPHVIHQTWEVAGNPRAIPIRVDSLMERAEPWLGLPGCGPTRT